MSDVICVSDNGSLVSEEFSSVPDAQKFIDGHCEEDQYLMKIHSMDRDLFLGRLALSRLFSSSDAIDIEKSIQSEDDPAEVYRQLALITSDSWVYQKYADDVKCYFIHGPQDVENDWKFKGFVEYLTQLRKDIDFAEDYDKAFDKHCIGGSNA